MIKAGVVVRRLLEVACGCVAVGAPVAIAAQEVTGVVHITGSTSPASGATVVLIDSVGRIVRGVIVRNDGSFVLRAPIAGHYRVRARQIGFSPDSSGTLDLASGNTAPIKLSLAHFATSLSAIHVAEARRCTVAPAAGTMALELWQDVQSALTATIVTASGQPSGQRSSHALLTQFSREIDPATRRVVRSTSWQTTGSGTEPYGALPADSLAARGFVVNEGQDVVYYAPDARTLLSDSFARTHCFRPAENADHPELIGLAFAPVQKNARGQVAGALWMDRTSRELRYLDFRYSNPASLTTGDNTTDATGRIDYSRLSAGEWIVSHWILNIPIVVMIDARTISSGGSLEVGAGLMAKRIPHLQSLWEIGGDASVTADSDAGITTAASVIAGQVTNGVDSLAARPAVQGLRVQLTPATDTASTTALQRITAADGSFSFDSVSSGDYVIHITSPRLDTLGVEIPDRPIHVNRATRVTITTTLPSMTAALTTLCGAPYRPGDMVIHGIVRDLKSGKPLSGATVKDLWYDEISTGRNFSARTQSASTRTAADGNYSLCIAAPRRTLSISATLGARKSLIERIEPSANRVYMLDFVM
ncbi:MAG: carboxypeptidase regulatory-like domain-containing protein [Gemmatimonadaceae bacterium]